MTKQASVPPRRSQELLDEEPCRVAGGSLVMYGYDGKPAARYHLEDAWSGGQGHLRSHRAGPRPRRRGHLAKSPPWHSDSGRAATRRIPAGVIY